MISDAQLLLNLGRVYVDVGISTRLHWGSQRSNDQSRLGPVMGPAGIIPKSILMDEFGFRPETCEWIIGGLDWPLKPIDFVLAMRPANVKVSDVAKGKELGAMLEDGEIDALISADNPKCILNHSPKGDAVV